MNKYIYDLVIVGGGTAGISAAYISAKKGLRTLLVEQADVLGGSITQGLVIPVMKLNSENINTEFYSDLLTFSKKYNASITYCDGNSGWFNPELLKIVLDDMFESHVQGALEEGLHVGVYFFSQALNYDEGVEEANFVLNAIRDYNITCPVAIDTEFLDASDARTNGLDIDSRTDSIVGFCETVKAAGYIPMIYSNRNWYVQSLDMSRLGDYKLWLAHYTNQPDFPYKYVGWQYTDQGTLSGVEGSVDLNVWFK